MSPTSNSPATSAVRPTPASWFHCSALDAASRSRCRALSCCADTWLTKAAPAITPTIARATTRAASTLVVRRSRRRRASSARDAVRNSASRGASGTRRPARYASACASAGPVNSRCSGWLSAAHCCAPRSKGVVWAWRHAALLPRIGATNRSCVSSYQVAWRRCSARTRCASMSRVSRAASAGPARSGPAKSCPRRPCGVISLSSNQSRTSPLGTPTDQAAHSTCMS